MFLISLIATMTSVAAPLPQQQVKLTSDERWTLINGLEQQAGGRFILTGVAKAEGTCRSNRSCVTPNDLRAGAVSGRASSIDQLIAGADVYGEKPVAIVAVRGVRQLSRYNTQLLLSVYDPRTRSWTDKTGSFRTLSPGTPDGAGQRILTQLRNAPGFGL